MFTKETKKQMFQGIHNPARETCRWVTIIQLSDTLHYTGRLSKLCVIFLCMGRNRGMEWGVVKKGFPAEMAY